jgi:sigma-B regulation protein RsbU (phosphoserine phosphatase)
LFMARTRSLLRAITLQFSDATGHRPRPSEIASVMNTELCKNNPMGMFVTLFFGFLDLVTGVLYFVNAGHVRPFILHADMPALELSCVNGPPLGVIEDVRYRDAELEIARGDGMVIVSDGMPDMINASGDSYTLNRLLADLHEIGHLPPAQLTRALVERVFAFANDAPQEDDVTLLAIRRPRSAFSGPTVPQS